MIQKTPKSLWKGIFKKGFYSLVIFESVAFIGSYYVWYRLNNNRDFRLYMHKSFPTILEGYYLFGEKIDPNLKIRKLDLDIWRQEGKLN